MNDKNIRELLKEFANVVVTEYRHGNPTINQQYNEGVRQVKILWLRELRQLKQIDCFNEAYTSDPRPAKHIDIKIKELEQSLDTWHVMDANDDLPYGYPDK